MKAEKLTAKMKRRRYEGSPTKNQRRLEKLYWQMGASYRCFERQNRDIIKLLTRPRT
jgi:hypothetical protein